MHTCRPTSRKLMVLHCIFGHHPVLVLRNFHNRILLIGLLCFSNLTSFFFCSFFFLNFFFTATTRSFDYDISWMGASILGACLTPVWVWLIRLVCHAVDVSKSRIDVTCSNTKSRQALLS